MYFIFLLNFNNHLLLVSLTRNFHSVYNFNLHFHSEQGVLDGKYDDLSEQSFYMVGGIEEVIAKAEKIAKESAS